MLRRIVAALTLALAGVLMFPALIAAAAPPPYPAPPVTPPPYPAPPVSVANGGPFPGVAHTADTTLASTGIGFSVGAALLIAVAVLLIGMTMIVTVRRFRNSGR